jgi:maltooligosyltrehalose trehalohydrolase
MGEEWAAREPFPFFCDFTGELANAVRDGRRREFAAAYARYGTHGRYWNADVSDPVSVETRASAVLDWSTVATRAHAARLALTRALLDARKRAVVPLLPAMKPGGDVSFDNGVLSARWCAGAQMLGLLANLSDAEASQPNTLPWGEPVWGGEPPHTLPPWSVYAAIADA